MSSILRSSMHSGSLLAMLAGCLSMSGHALADPYATASGAKPDMQSKQLVGTQTVAITVFDKICRDPSAAGGRYGEIAEILAGQLASAFGANLSIVSLNAQSDNSDQVVMGDPSSPVVSQLAAALGRSVTDLGEDGYNLVAAPNPASTNGSWIILIVANTSKGVLRGAYALVDLLQDAGGNVENLRIRDYPDYEVRALMHWLPPLPSSYDALTVAEWVENQRTSFEQIAGWGANALTFGRSEFWKLNQQAKDGTNIGARMAEVAYWARYYGMEPVPEVGSPLPYADPLWREGAFVRDEPFRIEPDLSTTPEATPLDNAARGLDFETSDGGSPPFASGWSQSGTSPTAWQYGSDARGAYVSYTGYGSKFLRTAAWDANTLKPGSFYVLEGHFNTVAGGTDASGKPQQMWLAVGGIRNGGPMAWFFHDWLRNRDGRFVEDFYFWTPPSAAQAASDPRYAGYQGVLFEELTDIRLQFYNADGTWTSGEPVSLQIDGIFLERRHASLRNVMRTDDPLDLKFTVTSDEPDPAQRTTYVEGTDYELNYVPCPSFAMPTRTYDANGVFQAEYLSSIQWLNANDAGKTVLVSYTLGVPDDWNLGQQARTWCLKSPGLRQAVKGNLRHLYETVQIDPHGTGTTIAYAFAPAYIEVNVSEFRGANRCGRCVEAGDANGMYFANYLRDNVMGILDELVQEGFPAAQNTVVIANGSFSPGSITKNGQSIDSPGEQDDYQFHSYGGRYGDTAFRHNELVVFASTARRILFPIGNGNCPDSWNCNGWEYAARGLDWPYGYAPPANVYVLAMNNSDSGANPEHTASGEGHYDASTWLLPDCLGFYSIGPGYGSEPIVSHEEQEQKLMDYAWKRHSNPDATLQVRLAGSYVTDDAHAAVVSISQPTTLIFLPFGGAELRDPASSNYEVTGATIDWGFGDAPQSVLSSLNVGHLSHNYWRNGHVVKLTVQAQPTGGGTTVEHVARVTVVGPGDPPPPDPTETKGALAVPFALRSVGPNPFNPSTRIEFSLPTRGGVHLEVYDLRGRRIAWLLSGQIYDPGVHAVEWDGRDQLGSPIASGTYFLRLNAAGQSASRKLLLLK